jgi:hypothetical protein
MRKKGPEQVPLAPDMRRLLAEYYAADIARLSGLMPDLDTGLWRSASRAA